MTDNEVKGIVGATAEVANKMVSNLPGQFLALVLMSLLFNLGMIWFFMHETTSRERIFTPVLAACANSVPLEALKVMRRPASVEE